MQRIFIPTLVALFIFSIAVSQHKTAHAAVQDWQRGASLYPASAGDFASENTRQSIRNLSETGANYVTFVIPYYQSNRHSVDIQRGFNTPTDESLISAIQFARSLGMQVSIVIHLDMMHEKAWRAEINPSDRDTWFSAYGNVLNHYAAMARDHGVARFIIGSELIRMSTHTSDPANTARWQSLIANVRQNYPGIVTYSANWGPSGFADEKNQIEFWGSLDFIGIAAYFELHTAGDVESLRGAWDRWNSDHIRPLSERFGKPVLFTEVGYKSVAGSHTRPWDFNFSGPADQSAQANMYEALFSYWNDFPYMRGVSLWNWETNPNAGGPGNIDYTPQNKQAEEIMRRWFAAVTPPPQDPPQEIEFQSSARAFPESPERGRETILTVNVASVQPAQNVIVDIEVFNSAGAKVFQIFFENQNFAVNQTRVYQAAFIPGETGLHVVKIGIFSAEWTRLLHWNDRAQVIEVHSGPAPPSPTPPPSPATLEIWWPTEGVTVSGIQPFKAMLTHMDVSQYIMFWQVDGDRLNPMQDDFTDWPHKETLVDLSGWRWKNSGPYVVNFIAQNLTGSRIAERAISIFVSH